jgi:hypothetical protein
MATFVRCDNPDCGRWTRAGSYNDGVRYYHVQRGRANMLDACSEPCLQIVARMGWDDVARQPMPQPRAYEEQHV